MAEQDLQQEQLESEAEQQAAQDELVQQQQAEKQTKLGQAKQAAKEAIKKKVKQEIKKQAARGLGQLLAATAEFWVPALLILIGIFLLLLLIAYGYYCTDSVENAKDCYNTAGIGIVPLMVVIKGATWVKAALSFAADALKSIGVL